MIELIRNRIDAVAVLRCAISAGPVGDRRPAPCADAEVQALADGSDGDPPACRC
ncbi:hypothetical protein [Roseisalinus antarcticus]|uniref:hypothetical protein n=1 Tax=Roseisalinus antarcticus TaxID=254357 RepID=UPI001356444C|nr:hypothetical protein [Roseisalinus antarcticus]